MTSTSLTRRAALGALAASPVVLALPAAGAPAMTLQERLEHHFEGLASAMAEISCGKLEVRVVSGDSVQDLWLRPVRADAPPPDPVIEALARRQSIVDWVNSGAWPDSDEKRVSDLLDVGDAILAASPIETRQGALAALHFVSREFRDLFEDDLRPHDAMLLALLEKAVSAVDRT